MIKMSRLDLYLKRTYTEYGMDYLEDYYEMYDFVINDDLRKILAAFHTNLNKWFAVMNNDIRTIYDEDGTIKYDGGYFHAQDSRDYLSLIEKIDTLRSRLASSECAFKFCNDNYDDIVRRTKRFVEKFRGSTIPEGFRPIDIEELNPIFGLVSGVIIEKNDKKVYANMKLIGEGSYAKVFLYNDPIYNIPIALKRADPSLDNKELERFKQEFQILKELHSPYLIEAYAFDSKKNEYTMEYMDETVEKYISRENTALSLKERKNIIAQICKGLTYIHNKGILHRDISLTNVFVKHYEDVNVIKLGDFGLIKNPQNTLTSLQSEIKGSLNDPNLINVGFENYEIRHETFALTRLCYFVLTGRTNISKQKEGKIKDFWKKGTSGNMDERFQNVDDLYEMVRSIDEKNM